MKNPEIKELNIEELKERVKVEKERLQKLIFANTVAPIENPNKIRFGKRYIAQLNTILRQKEYELLRQKCEEQLVSTGVITSQAFDEVIGKVQKETNIKATKKFIAQLAQEMKVVVLQ